MEDNPDLRFADALVMSAILEHARQIPDEEKLFVSRDAKAFNKAIDAGSILEPLNGAYLPKCSAALGRLGFT